MAKQRSPEEKRKKLEKAIFSHMFDAFEYAEQLTEGDWDAARKYLADIVPFLMGADEEFMVRIVPFEEIGVAQ